MHINHTFPGSNDLMDLLEKGRQRLKQTKQSLAVQAHEMAIAQQQVKEAKKDFKEKDKFVEDTARSAVISYAKPGDYSIQMVSTNEGILRLNWETDKDPYYGNAHFMDWLTALGIAEFYISLKEERDFNTKSGQDRIIQ